MYCRVSSRLFIFEEFECFRAERVHTVANRSARQNGQQYVIDMPIGNSPPKSPDDGALSDLRAAAYRDSHPARVPQRLGFRTDRDVVRPDLAFSLPRPAAAAPGGVTAERDDSRHRRVAVGLFNFRGRGQENPADAAAYHVYLDHICSLILWLRRSGSWWSNLAPWTS